MFVAPGYLPFSRKMRSRRSKSASIPPFFCAHVEGVAAQRTPLESLGNHNPDPGAPRAPHSFHSFSQFHSPDITPGGSGNPS